MNHYFVQTILYILASFKGNIDINIDIDIDINSNITYTRHACTPLPCVQYPPYAPEQSASCR